MPFDLVPQLDRDDLLVLAGLVRAFELYTGDRPHDFETDVMIAALATGQPERARLLRQRFSERQRLSELRRRLADLDPERHANAMASLQEAVCASADRLAAIEAELTGGEVVVRAPEPLTTQQEAKAALRQRLVHLELVLQPQTPPSCATAARRLRQAIRRELRGLEHA